MNETIKDIEIEEVYSISFVLLPVKYGMVYANTGGCVVSARLIHPFTILCLLTISSAFMSDELQISLDR